MSITMFNSLTDGMVICQFGVESQDMPLFITEKIKVRVWPMDGIPAI
jgi:hypothetical protein